MMVVGCSSCTSSTSPRSPASNRGRPPSSSPSGTIHGSSSGLSLPKSRANALEILYPRRRVAPPIARSRATSAVGRRTAFNPESCSPSGRNDDSRKSEMGVSKDGRSPLASSLLWNSRALLPARVSLGASRRLSGDVVVKSCFDPSSGSSGCASSWNSSPSSSSTTASSASSSNASDAPMADDDTYVGSVRFCSRSNSASTKSKSMLPGGMAPAWLGSVPAPAGGRT
mmetsp:Transcript_30315/g.103039  ORF Transcript_30315/g.103039 Transcript_30315/m.103039 type:complete len:227 (-) Transcript_30315:1259-1939(-)